MSSELINSIFTKDVCWKEVVELIQNHHQQEGTLLAPSEFKQQFASVFPYRSSYIEPLDRFAWIVVHKGRIAEIDHAFLNRAAREYSVVFANAVFVVLTSPGHGLSQIPFNDLHLQSFFEQLDSSPRAVSTSSTAKQLELEDLAIVSRTELEQLSKRAAQTTYLGNNTILCRILSRYLCYVAAEDKSLTPHLCMNGYWEPWITQALARILQPGWYCLDIGANCGYFALLMADAVGQSGRVLAIEANPRLAELVDTSLELNGFNHATVDQLAVSDSNESRIKFKIPTDGYLGNSQLPRHTIGSETSQRQRLRQNRSRTIRVPTATVDRLTQDWPRVDCLKIDAEGAEYAIWQGMQQTIQRNPKICLILEFAPSRYPDPASFIAQIQAAGFLLRYVDSDAQIKPLTLEEALDLSKFNYWDLFLQRE